MAVTAIRLSSRVVALGAVGDDIVDGVFDLLEKLCAGKGPTAAEVEKLDDYFKLCVKRLENFYFLDIADDSVAPKAKMFAKASAVTKTVIGAEAVQVLYKTMVARFENPKGDTPNVYDLKPLKTYSWILSSVQNGIVKKMNQHANAATPKGASGLEALDDLLSGGEIVPASSASASSSCAAAGKPIPLSKKEKKVDEATSSKRAKMLKFCFGPTSSG